ncbi:MAG: L,D-transpeptidase [Pseudomonadota bacterium]
MFSRRRFIATASATASVTALAAPAIASDTKMRVFDLPDHLQPRRVKLRAELQPGQIHVDPTTFSLYLTRPNREAFRWTVGIGKPGLYEPGTYYVGRKARWPSWKPTPAMIKRDPAAYEKYADGMPGGVNNPLGARAIYLYDQRRGDTMLRIHGTNKPGTLGRAVSNGCARIVNQQIIPFYDMVPTGTVVYLHKKPAEGSVPFLQEADPKKDPMGDFFRRLRGTA